MLDEVSGHQGENDLYTAVQGIIYDIMDFIEGNHAAGLSMKKHDYDTLEQLAVPQAIDVSGAAGVTDDMTDVERYTQSLCQR
ncbi:hypothetical protein BKA70DRAFT_1424490 [Coprinopsis sp. MPI-PUGE-AT-0042]|nr:hypothetical protein BKA70DRAFT_1424490 [Coprinopsis sp. MPI-PUGE-AT-0042]